MKTLQNNFTTPEQSKRLLELGVPRWSADEYRNPKGYRNSLDGILDVELFFQNLPGYLPCWSVGRLMEIIDICVTNEQSNPLIEEYPTTIAILDRLHISYVEFLVRSIAIAKAAEVIDYSKLED